MKPVLLLAGWRTDLVRLFNYMWRVR